jgi:hypothetical protein
VIGAFIITTAIAIFWDSVNNAYDILTGVNQEKPEIQLLTFETAVFTIFLKLGLYFYTKIVAVRTKNVSAMALTYDHRNDIFASIGAAVGIGLGWVNAQSVFGLRQPSDPAYPQDRRGGLILFFKFYFLNKSFYYHMCTFVFNRFKFPFEKGTNYLL